MIVRIVQLLLGAGLAGGGGYVGWLNRGLVVSLFPADPTAPPWLLIGALLAVSTGLVLLVAGLLPQPARKVQAAAEAARREAALQAADTFYGERSRAADRDWRSGDLPPTPAPAAVAAPAAKVKPAVSPAASSVFPSTAALAPIPVAKDPPLQPVQGSTPAPTPKPQPAASPAPVSTPAPAPVQEPVPIVEVTEQTIAPAPTPQAPAPEPAAAVTDAPIAATASTPTMASPVVPPAVVTSVVGAPAVIAPETIPDTPFANIRAAISDSRLDEADKLLADQRAQAGMEGVALAELTGLAGDHAAAAGRPGNAKWLWRLALKRFADAGEISSAPARDVSERLRLIDQ